MRKQSRYRKLGAPKSTRPPKSVTSDGTRDRILDAARKLFAEFGYNGTSVRDITAAAGVNLAAVTYHFTTKELLYTHVLFGIVMPLGSRIEWVTRGDRPPLDKIDAVVRSFFQHIARNPDMPAFMVRELASGLEPSAPIVQMIERVLPRIAGVIADGQKDGSIRRGDPVLLSFSVIAQPVHLNLARRAIKAVSGVEVDQRVVDHVVETVRASLEAR